MGLSEAEDSQTGYALLKDVLAAFAKLVHCQVTRQHLLLPSSEFPSDQPSQKKTLCQGSKS
jgi:hypothetical protein